MDKQKVLIFIVSYNAEQFIEKVLDRIPPQVWNSDRYISEILIIDDSSQDRTFYKAEEYAKKRAKSNLTVLYNPKNQGYGGNQKIGFHYAIKNNFDLVVLLHGDGQYAPEFLPSMMEPLLFGEADVVLGSRMVHKLDALKGGMPLYKWLGNQVLTGIENYILNSNLSEFHTGYRAYRVAALSSVPFQYNSDYFDFDTDILIQLLETKKRIKEIPIPTFYGDEICRVNGLKYSALIVRSCVQAKVQKWGIQYHPKFDYKIRSNHHYTPKFGFASSHQYALDQLHPGQTVLDVGCGPGFMAFELAKKKIRTISIDRSIQPEVKEHTFQAIETDVDEFSFEFKSIKIDAVLALDIIEHLKFPEKFLQKIRENLVQSSPKLVITTGNVAFCSIRIGLLLGKFNYGKRGILDLDHKRLFTLYSLRNMLVMNGYEVIEEKGIPAPFALALGDNWIADLLVWANLSLIQVSKGMFAYQVAVVAIPKPTLRHLLQEAKIGREKMISIEDKQTINATGVVRRVGSLILQLFTIHNFHTTG